MARYRLVVKTPFAKDLRPIPNKEVRRILQRIGTLRVDPRPPGCEKLAGQERYRVRQGAYRIIYEVTDEDLIVVVVKVAHRKRVYKRT